MESGWEDEELQLLRTATTGVSSASRSRFQPHDNMVFVKPVFQHSGRQTMPRRSKSVLFWIPGFPDSSANVDMHMSLRQAMSSHEETLTQVVTSLRPVSLTVAASSCQDEPVLQLVQGRTPKDEQNLGYLGWIMMGPNLLDHWTIGCTIFWGG